MNTPPRDTLAAATNPWEAAIDAAFDLDRYAPNWDGEGADPVPEQLIRDTVEFLRHGRAMRMSAPDCIYPLADGTVMFEWHGGRGSAISLNLRPGKRAEILTSAPGREPVFEAVTLDLGEEADAATSQASGAARESDPFHTFELAA